MRFFTSLVLLLPALATAEQQIPLADKVKGWLNKAQSYIPSSAPSVPNPVDAGASKVAEKVVQPLTLENWKSVLTTSTSPASLGPEEWMIFVTGGNATCHGLCAHATRAWNESAALLSARPDAPRLGMLDCDAEQILCNIWVADPPCIFHMLIPQPLPDQSTPATTVRYKRLNRTSTTASDIVKLHTEEGYKDIPVYEGAFQPFDGFWAKTGLAVPLAYVMWAMGKMPSWLPMIAISFLSRSFMGRRAGGQRPRQGGAAPAPAQQ